MADECWKCGWGASNPNALEFGRGIKIKNTAPPNDYSLGSSGDTVYGLTREAFIAIIGHEPVEGSGTLGRINVAPKVITSKKKRSDFI